MPPDPRLKQIAARITELQARMSVSWREFSRLSSLSEAHVRLAVVNLEAGKKVTILTLMQIADGARVSPGWLISGEGSGPRLRETLQGWDELARNVRQRYPHVPDFSVDIVGDFTMPVTPDRVDETTIRDWALAWFSAASDELRSRVESTYVDRLRSAKKRPT